MCVLRFVVVPSASPDLLLASPSPAIRICLDNAKNRMSQAYFEHLICPRIDKRPSTRYADLPLIVCASRFILGSEVARRRNRNRGTEKKQRQRDRGTTWVHA
jgi:hypothetical protein